MDTYLNILQSVQLPFALIPLIKKTNLIKFAGNKKVMGKAVKGEFAISKNLVTFAKEFCVNLWFFGVLLFLMNFAIMF